MGEAARETRWRVDDFAQWASALGQRSAVMLAAAEIQPEAGGAAGLAIGQRRLKFVPERGADRGLEARHDPQRGQDRRRVARIRRRCKQPPQALGLCGEPSEARIELARQIERRLLACEPVCYLDLSRLDGGAILPDPRFDLPHGGSRGGHCLRRNQCSGQSCTLPLGFGSARLQPDAAFFEFLSAPFERDAARVGGGDGFGLPLQHCLRLSQASARFAQPSFGEFPTRTIRRLGPGDRVLLFG